MARLFDGGTDINALVHFLGGYRFNFVTERELQDGIEEVLKKSGVVYQRENALSAPDRPDFMVDRAIAIEVKIKGSLAALLRQASRYAAHPEVEAILVVGTPHWLSRVPPVLVDKPVRSLRLMGSLL
jgi:hypothetical protein